MNGVWQLPVLERIKINELYIKHNAKYHFYINDDIKSDGGVMRVKKSLCNKHTQFTEEFESIEDSKIVQNPTVACKKCFEKWKKEFHIGS